MKKSTLLHLRIPFSFFLLPVFMLAVAVSEQIDEKVLVLVFLILHFLVYPASNGFNSYFDKDEGSIGGLKRPPKTTKELYNTSILMDIFALVISLFISFEFAVMIFIYGMISKAYSHPIVRLKKLPFSGWLVAGVFQGYFTFLMTYIAINDTALVDSFHSKIQIPAILSTVLLLGSYPMTQIYQHEEDIKRGDITISQKLGIKGTFHFTALSFALASIGFFYYFNQNFSLEKAILFGVFMTPVLIYFGTWYLRVRKDINDANFDSTMKLNLISSLMLNGYFTYLWLS